MFGVGEVRECAGDIASGIKTCALPACATAKLGSAEMALSEAASAPG
jgi:hypothetical protein